jgi:hypothetical protein
MVLNEGQYCEFFFNDEFFLKDIYAAVLVAIGLQYWITKLQALICLQPSDQ